MSGGSGLRRFVAGTGASGTGADARVATPPAHVEAATETTTEGGTQAEAAGARATLSAALGRPLEPAEQVSTAAGTEEIEKCELCATVIPAEHGHLADLETSSLMCACRACYLLFTRPEAGRGPEAMRGRYRAIPDRYLTDPDHPMSTSEWDGLEIPVGLAFFLRDSGTGNVTGFYPSPAGATECRLDLQAWNELTAAHPLLAEAEPDVEAILISRPNPRAEEERAVETFVVPIDACYELAGRMRLYWRGFDGGSEANASIADFLDKVRTRARSIGRGA